MTQSQLLVQCMMLIVRNKVCPETKPHEWVKHLLYLHGRGFLYAAFEEPEKVALVAAMYRIPEFDEKKIDVFPEKEEGDILYVPFFASKANDKFLANRLLKSYVKKHAIKEIIFYEDRDNEKLKRYKRIKEEHYGEEKKPNVTSSAHI